MKKIVGKGAVRGQQRNPDLLGGRGGGGGLCVDHRSTRALPLRGGVKKSPVRTRKKRLAPVGGGRLNTAIVVERRAGK